MTESVPVMSLVFMAISLLFAVALPVGLCLYFRKVKKADMLPFFVGCAVMIVFAFVLEQLAHRMILGSSAGAVIRENIWLYALYGGAMAGVFEETGRFLAFRTILRKKQNKDVNALMYGAGHGGIEAFILLGIGSINNLVYAVLINTGNTAVLTAPLSGDTLTQVENAIQTLIKTPSGLFLLGDVERILAVTVHIALSVLVWFAAKNKGLRYLYPVAVLIHLVVDGTAAILSGYGVSLAVIEAVLAVLAAAAAFYAKKVWDNEQM